MSSAAEELSTAVSAAATRSRDLTATIVAAKSAAESADGAFQLSGGDDKLALLAIIQDALDEASRLQSQVDSKLSEVSAWTTRLHAGASGPALTGDGGGPSPPTPLSDRWAPPLPDFNPKRPHRDAEAEMRRIGWPPSNADPNKTSARGHLFDRNGRRMTGEPIQPHQKGTAPPCDELKEPWRSSEDYTTTWHAERDAAMMIREAVKEGHAGPFALYMNIAPCGRRTPDPPHTPDPRRCDENIARIVPRDVIVYAHIVSKRDPIPSRLRIVGTGEAISQC